jgi:hypothetical protein
MQSEQIVHGPAERFGLPNPLCEEGLRVLDRLLPVVRIDAIGAAALKLVERFTEGERNRICGFL